MRYVKNFLRKKEYGYQKSEFFGWQESFEKV